MGTGTGTETEHHPAFLGVAVSGLHHGMFLMPLNLTLIFDQRQRGVHWWSLGHFFLPLLHSIRHSLSPGEAALSRSCSHASWSSPTRQLLSFHLAGLPQCTGSISISIGGALFAASVPASTLAHSLFMYLSLTMQLVYPHGRSKRPDCKKH